MRTFTDTAGREWQLQVHGLSLKQVKEQTDVLLTNLFADECRLFIELVTDAGRLVDVLWAMCKKQADIWGVGAEQFAEGLGGDVYGAATFALARAVADFYPTKQREALHALLDKAEAAGDALVGAAAEQVQAIDIDTLVERFTTPAAVE